MRIMTKSFLTVSRMSGVRIPVAVMSSVSFRSYPHLRQLFFPAEETIANPLSISGALSFAMRPSYKRLSNVTLNAGRELRYWNDVASIIVFETPCADATVVERYSSCLQKDVNRCSGVAFDAFSLKRISFC